MVKTDTLNTSEYTSLWEIKWYPPFIIISQTPCAVQRIYSIPLPFLISFLIETTKVVSVASF